MTFLIPFLLGLPFGAVIGVCLLCLCQAAAQADAMSPYLARPAGQLRDFHVVHTDTGEEHLVTTKASPLGAADNSGHPAA